MTFEKCAICDGLLIKSLITISSPDRFERFLGVHSIGYKREWIACQCCGTASNIFDIGSKINFAELETAYYSVDMAGKDVGDRFHQIMALPPGKSDNILRVVRILDFLQEYSLEKIDVLDIGAGTGVFLSRLLDVAGDRISRATAIEPDPIAATHLKSLSRFEVIGEAFPLSGELRFFTLITLNKVLEHITEPIGFLRNIRPYLNIDRGFLYVEVPDVLTASFRDPCDNILGSLHRHLYSPEGLAIVLRAASMIPIRIVRFCEPSGKLSICAFAIPLISAGRLSTNWIDS